MLTCCLFADSCKRGIEKVISIAKPVSSDELEPLKRAIIEFRKAFKKETNKTIKDLDYAKFLANPTYIV